MRHEYGDWEVIKEDKELGKNIEQKTCSKCESTDIRTIILNRCAFSTDYRHEDGNGFRSCTYCSAFPKQFSQTMGCKGSKNKKKKKTVQFGKKNTKSEIPLRYISIINKMISWHSHLQKKNS